MNAPSSPQPIFPSRDLAKRPGLRGFVHDVWSLAFAVDLDVQASQVAFNAVFSLGPILALATSLLSLLPPETVASTIERTLFPYIPNAVWPLLQAQLETRIGGPNPLLVAGSVIALMWTLSSAAIAITTSLATLGWPQSGSYWRRRARAAVLGFVVVLGITVSALAAVIGPFVLSMLARIVPLTVPKLGLLALLRWPIAGLVYGAGCTLLLRFGTTARPRWRACLLGGLVTALVETVATLLLRVVFAHSPALGPALGSAGAVFAALLWLYVLALGLLIGGVAARVTEERRDAHARR